MTLVCHLTFKKQIKTLLVIENNKVIGLITARSGSKRVPNKNLRNFKGKSLIEWAGLACHKSKLIDHSFISTDSDEYGKEVLKYGIDLILRPNSISSDKSKSSDAVMHAYNKIILSQDVDYLVLLQPTSPLREKELIDKGIHHLHSNQDADQLIEFCNLRHFTFSVKGKFAYPDYPQDTRSQDLPIKLVPSGRLFIYNMKNLKDKNFDFDKALTIPMIGPDLEENINIDTEVDFRKMEFIYNLNKKKYLD